MGQHTSTIQEGIHVKCSSSYMYTMYIVTECCKTGMDILVILKLWASVVLLCNLCYNFFFQFHLKVSAH